MLHEKAIALASEPNYAVLTTLFDDGSPQTNIVWIDHDGEHLLVNTEEDRQKARNCRSEPRVGVIVWDRNNLWSSVEVRGKVVEIVEGQAARDHIDKMAKKYRGLDEYPNPILSPRVILKIAPDRQIVK